MKRLLSILLMICMLVAAGPQVASAATGSKDSARIARNVFLDQKTLDDMGTHTYNDMTKEEFLALAMKYVPEGTAVRMKFFYDHDYYISNASAFNEGKITAKILILGDDGSMENITFTVKIPQIKTDPSNAEADKKKVNAAKEQVEKAMAAYAYDNSTTSSDLLKAAKAAVTNGAQVEWYQGKPAVVVAATDFKEGSAVGSFEISYGSQRYIYKFHGTISKLEAEPVDESTLSGMDKAEKAVRKALDSISSDKMKSVETAKEAMRAALPAGYTIEFGKNFAFQKPTIEQKGQCGGTVTISDGTETRTCEIGTWYDKIVQNRPSKKISVNSYEWEILRLVNIERAKQGLNSLSMTKMLQDVANVREEELLEYYSHTRPNGQACDTAIPSSAKVRVVRENICRGTQQTPKSCMSSWMNSTGHRKNILSSDTQYIGVGVSNGRWMQMFTDGARIKSVKSSTGSKVFSSVDEMNRAYAILTATDGTVSYMPLDPDSMIKVKGGYQLRVNTQKKVIFKIKSK